MTQVTSEAPTDAAEIDVVHRAAFRTGSEAELVAQLRAADAFDPSLSLVARADGDVVGHALLTPLGVAGDWDALVLAPVAVAPVRQGAGIGSELVRASLDRARDDGWDAVFLHGAPTFYTRFGFRPAGDLGFENPFDTPPQEFMVARLTDDDPVGGPLAYPPAFDVL